MNYRNELIHFFDTHLLFKKRVLKQLKKGSVCCEIGVWRGDFSLNILDTVKPNKLHLIDPWEFKGDYKGCWYGGLIAKDQKDMENIFKEAKRKIKKHNNVVIHRTSSDDAVKEFDDEYFDFVYIDGDHSFRQVLRDLENYYPKLKKGGILSGDDYYWNIKDGLPIRKAVKEFCINKNINYKMLGTQFLIFRE